RRRLLDWIQLHLPERGIGGIHEELAQPIPGVACGGFGGGDAPPARGGLLFPPEEGRSPLPSGQSPEPRLSSQDHHHEQRCALHVQYACLTAATVCATDSRNLSSELV